MFDQFQRVIRTRSSSGSDGLERSFEIMIGRLRRHSLSHRVLWDTSEEVWRSSGVMVEKAREMLASRENVLSLGEFGDVVSRFQGRCRLPDGTENLLNSLEEFYHISAVGV